MRIRPYIPIVSWGFCLVVGLLWDGRCRTLYVFPLPGIGITIEFPPPQAAPETAV